VENGGYWKCHSAMDPKIPPARRELFHCSHAFSVFDCVHRDPPFYPPRGCRTVPGSPGSAIHFFVLHQLESPSANTRPGHVLGCIADSDGIGFKFLCKRIDGESGNGPFWGISGLTRGDRTSFAAPEIAHSLCVESTIPGRFGINSAEPGRTGRDQFGHLRSRNGWRQAWTMHRGTMTAEVLSDHY